jgi:hypothetical protein
MKKIGISACNLLFLCFISEFLLHAQNENFIVTRTSFCSHISDEFSPVYYRDGLVFCGNRGSGSIIGYTENKKGLFNILYVKKTNSGWNKPEVFASSLTSFYNDGPITFNSSGNIAYFSRNVRIDNKLGNVNDTTNKLGIYYAELSGENWTNIRPFDYMDTKSNYSAPSLSPDGSRLFFSSDRPGGYGGMDLYFCEKKDGKWTEPLNMGPMINTAKSESFPFASRDGKLFFSSDGHCGFGGKDIFYTSQTGGIWIAPVHLDSAINSIADDFALVTDSTFEKGYFSSNRMKTDDIYSFTIFQPRFANCDTIQENNYCFTFYDEKQQLTDTVPVTYCWDFGDGQIRKGKEVRYCFPGAGEYTVKLTILDAVEGKPMADKVEYKVDLKDIEQFMIGSDNIGMIRQPLSFQAIQTGLADFTPKEYFWNFGEGYRPGGPVEDKIFGRKGEYTVQLGLWGQKDSTGIIQEKCYQKNVKIFDSYEEMMLSKQQDKSLQNKSTK